MAKETVQDIIEFDLFSERTVVNKTVKLVAKIVAMNKSDVPEATLTANVQRMMKEFIDAPWSFSNMQRGADASGMERVTLQASARVPESQNYNLDKRTRAVSTEGLNIVSVQPDTTPPLSDIESTESDLRADLMIKAQKELEVINRAMGVDYRVGRITFQSANNASNYQLSNASRAPKTAMALSYGAGMAAEDAGLGNAVKLTMQATIEYRRSPKDKG